MYFEKKRAFATGIAVCGSGLGTFIWAPLTQTLVDNFGWKISFLITGAILLLNVMFGALFRPLPNASIDSGSTAETPNDLDENEAFTSRMTSKNHSFCSDQGFATPVSYQNVLFLCSILAFSTKFCPITIDLSGNTV